MYHIRKMDWDFDSPGWQKVFDEADEKNRKDQEKRLKKEARMARKKRPRKIVFYQTVDNPFDPYDEYNNLTAIDEKGKTIYYWEGKPYCGKHIGDVRPEDITSFDGWEKYTLWDCMHTGLWHPWWWRWGDWKSMKIGAVPGNRFDPMDGRVTTWTVKMYI